MSSVIILAVALFLAATGSFIEASAEVKAFAVAVVFSTGSLSLINQFAAIREGSAVITDLAGGTSATEKTLAGSKNFLRLTQIVMTVFAIVTFVLFVLAIY